MKKHSVMIFGHATSFSLEDEFWEELQRIVQKEKCPLCTLIAEVDKNRTTNLSSALRVFILKKLKSE